MCQSVSKQDVIGYLKVLLKSADLESTTEESLHSKLSDHFKQDVTQFSKDIQAEIENFVVMSAKSGVALSNKRGRENCDPEASSVKTGKVSTPAEKSCEFPLSEDGLTLCSIKEFKGKTYVDIRNHYKKGDDVLPTKKGLMITVPEWLILAASIPGLCDAVEKSDTSHTVQLSAKRRVTVTDFIKNTISVDIREFYGEGSDCKPSQKGIMLKAPAFKVLCGYADAISSSLPVSGAGAPDTDAHASTAYATVHVDAAAPGLGTVQPAGDSSAAGISTLTIKSGETMWCLSSSTERNVKLAGANIFKDKRYISIREHYQKDGQWLPGKKGLNLTQDQFEALYSHQQEISGAVAAKDLSLRVALSDIRTVALNEFKNKVYVHIRESYGKDGESDPCRGKGIGLSAEEWGNLAAVLPKIQAVLE